jgi:DNA (cytosine-5)-methyltransferase 1
MSSAPTFLDLFCGCGGFSLGMERAGFQWVAAIDFNPEAIATFRVNFPQLPEDRVRQEDLTRFRPADLAKIIGGEKVDVIVGGPPCQGFSTVRQRDGANQGTARFVEDARRQLYREFLRYVEFFQPRVFVMENVLGIQSAAGGAYFTRVQHEARQLGYRVVPQIADAFALGVPQKRRRQLIVGVRGDLPGFFPSTLAPAERAFPGTTLGPAIGDLPRLAAGGGVETCDYDLERRSRHLAKWGKAARRYLYRVLEIARAEQLTAHRARPHSDRDLRDFALLAEGQSSADAMRRGVEFEFPYDKTSFQDRYTRQGRRKPCSTIVAHLSKDGLMFIHPTQNRSLTPREAARIQSFPDWFQFPVARTHQFRIIGNAVPPLVGEAVGLEVHAFLDANAAVKPRGKHRKQYATPAVDDLIPQSQREAAARLQEIADLDRRQLRACEKRTFLRGWFSLFYLFPGLHPDNALDHGAPDSIWSPEQLPLPGLEDFATRRFARSGWPVALELLGREAWRRFEGRELGDEEFYCASAQRAGMSERDEAQIAGATGPSRPNVKVASTNTASHQT